MNDMAERIQALADELENYLAYETEEEHASTIAQLVAAQTYLEKAKERIETYDRLRECLQ